LKYTNKIVVALAILSSAFIAGSDPTIIKIKQTFESFTTDNIWNVYLTNKEELTKYKPDGTLFKKYSNMRLGKISFVDATNPLKILVYYKDFQQIVFLDNQLSENSENISLENLGYEQTELVCTSFNNSFWIYNKQNNELVRFNENSQPIAKTGNLKQVLQVNNLKPNFMTEYNGYLYLNSPENGVYVFDIYGTFTKIISLKNLGPFQASNNILYFYKDRKLCSYNSVTFEEACLGLNDSLVKSQRVEKDRLFVAYGDSLKVFVNSPK
jgi:hypothetical protein